MKPEQEVMLGINIFGIFAGIKVHSGRLNSFKADINKFNVLIRFQYYVVLCSCGQIEEYFITQCLLKHGKMHDLEDFYKAIFPPIFPVFLEFRVT
jgi:hypothetical protein